MQQDVPEFGLYFYAWYSSKKWSEHTVRHTPRVGWYESGNDALIDWQAEMLASTGVDYIVFEVVPTSDWCFNSTMSTIAAMIPRLETLRIGYTFLLDVCIDQQKSHADSFDDMLIEIKKRGWLDKCRRDKFQRPVIFGFSPICVEAEKILSKYPDLQIYFPVWIPVWGEFRELRDWISAQKNPVVNQLSDFFFQGYRNEKETIREILEKLNYIQFWQPTPHLHNIHGFASIVPGYDDLLMHRSPQLAPRVDRENGKTFFSQFSRAVESGAKDILIYGWNEYFEATNIEPTLEYGDFYVQLLQSLIRQVREGVPLAMPDAMPECNVPALYLTQAIRNASQRYADRIPRWDRDNYVAKITVPNSGVLSDDRFVFNGISVCNDGLKSWNVASVGEPIRLGIRLYDEHDQVVREGRSELGNADVPSGQSIVTDIALETRGLSAGVYRAVIDLVWEHKFWFQSESHQSVLLV